MMEAFQNVVMRLAICGLGVSLAAMALREEAEDGARAMKQALPERGFS